MSFVLLNKPLLEEIGGLSDTRGHLPGLGDVSCPHYHSDHEWGLRVAKQRYKHYVHPIIVTRYHNEDGDLR